MSYNSVRDCLLFKSYVGAKGDGSSSKVFSVHALRPEFRLLGPKEEAKVAHAYNPNTVEVEMGRWLLLTG